MRKSRNVKCKLQNYLLLATACLLLPKASLGMWSQPGDSAWSMFRHDTYHTGVSPLTGNMDTCVLLWKKSIWYLGYPSPILGDIDEDGKLEVVIGGSYDGTIKAFNAEDGSDLWSYTTGDFIQSSAAIGDIDGDGKPEVVVGSDDSSVYALNGENGSFLWSYPTSGCVQSSAAIGDIDNDGKMEVVFGCNAWQTGPNIYALNGEDGSPLWSFFTNDYSEIFCSPALADIDDDDTLEVIISSLATNLYALNGEDGSLLWCTKCSNYSSPALGDIDVDGKLEIVIGSYTGVIKAIESENGSVKWTYYTYTGDTIWYAFSSPALADIDDDSRLEVVIGIGTSCSERPESGGKILALNAENGSLLWYCATRGSIRSSPALGDIDGDGKLEAVVATLTYGDLLAVNAENGSSLWTYTMGGDFIAGSPAIGDIDNDGKAEVVAGLVYAFNGRDVGIEENSQPEADPPLAEKLEIYPNPFINTTEIRVQGLGISRLQIYDLGGRLVKSFSLTTNNQQLTTAVSWDGKDHSGNKVPAGIYFCNIEAGKFSARGGSTSGGKTTRKLTIIK